nr:hypothetical protein CFP56_64002 [Quercus suber]
MSLSWIGLQPARCSALSSGRYHGASHEKRAIVIMPHIACLKSTLWASIRPSNPTSDPPSYATRAGYGQTLSESLCCGNSRRYIVGSQELQVGAPRFEAQRAISSKRRLL